MCIVNCACIRSQPSVLYTNPHLQFIPCTTFFLHKQNCEVLHNLAYFLKVYRCKLRKVAFYIQTSIYS